MTKRTVVLAVVLVTSLPGCVDLNEDVVTGLTPGAYGSEAVFQALVNATYEPLRSLWGQERGFTLTEFGTDIFYKGADGSYKFVNDYTTQLNPTVDYFTNTWNDFYRAINTINAALDQAPVVQMDSSVKVERMAEVRFLRALYYFYLVQMFGPVHITLHEIKTPTTEAHRYPLDSVYDGVIIPDLQYAEAHLPAVQQDYGRATKGAVDHLLAKVYLARLRVPGDAAADEIAKRQAGDFANAAHYARQVIDSGPYQLLPRFADVFDFHNERHAQVPSGRHGGASLDGGLGHGAGDPAKPGSLPRLHPEDVQRPDLPVAEQVPGSVPAQRQRDARLAGFPVVPPGRDGLDRGRGAAARRPAGGGAPLHQRGAAARRHPGARDRDGADGRSAHARRGVERARPRAGR